MRVVEAALLRMICAALECPLPPFIAALTPDKLRADEPARTAQPA